jgi:hypothetical protein
MPCVDLARAEPIAVGLRPISLVALYGAGFLAKRGCRTHCCTVGVEASVAQAEFECREVFGVIVFIVD